jgi:AcrR family transcriptional regulator
MTETRPTRKRLLDEGMRLFARNGFHATTVGDIEAAAGLQPRRGALYKHFPSKQGLLDEAIRSHVDRAAAGAAHISAVDLGAVVGDDRNVKRLLVEGLGRWFLDEMDNMRDLTRVLEHDGDRMGDVTHEVKRDIVDLSYRTAVALIAAVVPDARDPDAVAVVLLGALVAFRRTTWTFGTPPAGVDDDRALSSWTELALAWLDPQLDQS